MMWVCSNTVYPQNPVVYHQVLYSNGHKLGVDPIFRQFQLSYCWLYIPFDSTFKPHSSHIRPPFRSTRNSLEPSWATGQWRCTTMGAVLRVCPTRQAGTMFHGQQGKWAGRESSVAFFWVQFSGQQQVGVKFSSSHFWGGPHFWGWHN